MRLRALVLSACLLALTGCGLYGEKGFTGKNALPGPRFIEDVDDECQEINEDLDAETAALLAAAPEADDDAEDAIGDLRDGIDELVEELPDHYGPEALEQARDGYVKVLEAADEDLDAARDALKDDDGDAFRARIAAVKASLRGAEETLRAAGFTVCGTPRPEED